MKKKLSVSSFVAAVCCLLGSMNAGAQNWSLAGNNNVNASSKLGSVNAQPVRFFTNNAERMRIDPQGRFGMGTTNPNNSALLDLSSTSRGLLIPRMTAAQKTAIASPAIGLMIYQTNGVSGFYYYSSTGWLPVAPSVTGFANTALSNLSATTSINTSLVPQGIGVHDVGGLDNGWKDLYLNGIVYHNSLPFLKTDHTKKTLHLGEFAGGDVFGDNSIAIGHWAMSNGNTGANNIAVGNFSLGADVTGFDNVAVGTNAMRNSSQSYSNVAVGSDASYESTYGAQNVAVGYWALRSNLGSNNTGIGAYSMSNALYGEYNTGVGGVTLRANEEGWFNSALGYSSLASTTIGSLNTGMGTYSLSSNTDGAGNAALGYSALGSMTAGNSNTAVGRSAGDGLSAADALTLIGGDANVTVNGLNNSTALGYLTTVTASNQVRIGNSAVTSIGGYVNWSNLSDVRFKKNMKENVPGLDFINRLRPVTYTLDMDGLDNALKAPESKSPASKLKGAKIPDNTDLSKSAKTAKAQITQTGFVAQEVEKIAKELNFDFSGVDAPKNSKDLYGLRYAEFVVPLVKAVQELDQKTKEIDELKRQNQSLEERLKKLEELVKGSSSNTSVLLSGAKLEQIAPNPVTATSIINYVIPENEGAAKLVFTDMKGSVIKSIALNGKGRGQVQINKGTLAAGEYIYTLWLGDRSVDSKRMTIVR